MTSSAPTTKITLTRDELRDYMLEVRGQAATMRAAGAQLNNSVNSHAEPNTVLASAQIAVNAASAISKLLWVTFPKKEDLSDFEIERRQWSVSRAKQLRESFGKINEAKSPLGNRSVRNAFEHIEERMDEFLLQIRKGMRPSINVKVMVGPRSSVMTPDGPLVSLRHYDPYAKRVAVLETAMDLQALFDEVNRVDAMAEHWLQEYDRSLFYRPQT